MKYRKYFLKSSREGFIFVNGGGIFIYYYIQGKVRKCDLCLREKVINGN